MATDTLASDGLPALLVRSWAKEKLHHLRYYTNIFSQGMQRRWKKRVYIDLFSGPGKSIVRETREEIDGSPVIALKAKVPFTDYYFNELKPKYLDALRQRVGQLRQQAPQLPVPQFLDKDANDAAQLIANSLPEDALILLFADPWGLELALASVEQLVRGRRADLILTIQTGGIKRMLGALGQHPKSPEILDVFLSQLRSWGYGFTDARVMMRNKKNVPLYHLVFASKHPRGEEFWRKTVCTRLLL